MSNEIQPVLYEHQRTGRTGQNILITSKAIVRNGKIIPIRDVNKAFLAKSAWGGNRAYEVVVEVGWIFKGRWSLLELEAIDDNMNFSDEDKKQIEKLYRAIDIARAS